MKKLIFASLTILLLVILVACGSQETETPVAEVEEPTEAVVEEPTEAVEEPTEAVE
jgi:curli biogenesis system outer membrane secretion channel CsgG